MVFPWFAAQASVAVLAAGGAAGGFVSYVVRTRVIGMSRKDSPGLGKSLDEAVVPIRVETPEAEQMERLEMGARASSHEHWEADATPSKRDCHGGTENTEE